MNNEYQDRKRPSSATGMVRRSIQNTSSKLTKESSLLLTPVTYPLWHTPNQWKSTTSIELDWNSPEIIRLKAKIRSSRSSLSSFTSTSIKSEKNSVDDTNNHNSNKIEYLNWIDLRNGYMAELNLFVHQKVDRNNVIQKKRFLILIQAIRKITYRILEFYYNNINTNLNTNLNTNVINNTSPSTSEFHNLRQYILSFVTDYNILPTDPYAYWTGIECSQNPLLCSTCIHGKSSEVMEERFNKISLEKRKSMSTPITIASELRLHPIEEKNYQRMQSFLWDIYNQQTFTSDSNPNSTSIISSPNRNRPSSANVVLVSNRKTFIYDSIPSERVTIKSEDTVDHVADTCNDRILRNRFYQWRRAVFYWNRIQQFIYYRQNRIKRQVIEALQHYRWQGLHFRRLQSNYMVNLQSIVYNHWMKYHIYCQTINHIYYKSLLRTQSYYFHQLVSHSQENHQNRNFHKRWKKKRMILYFKQWKKSYDIRLFQKKWNSKSILDFRLFYDRNILLYQFYEWKKRYRLYKAVRIFYRHHRIRRLHSHFYHWIGYCNYTLRLYDQIPISPYANDSFLSSPLSTSSVRIRPIQIQSPIDKSVDKSTDDSLNQSTRKTQSLLSFARNTRLSVNTMGNGKDVIRLPKSEKYKNDRIYNNSNRSSVLMDRDVSIASITTLPIHSHSKLPVNSHNIYHHHHHDQSNDSIRPLNAIIESSPDRDQLNKNDNQPQKNDNIDVVIAANENETKDSPLSQPTEETSSDHPCNSIPIRPIVSGHRGMLSFIQESKRMWNSIRGTLGFHNKGNNSNADHPSHRSHPDHHVENGNNDADADAKNSIEIRTEDRKEQDPSKIDIQLYCNI